MLFGLRIRVGPRSHVLDRGPGPWELGKGNFEVRREGAAHCKVQEHSAVSCAKTADPVEMLFGLLTRVGPRKY